MAQLVRRMAGSLLRAVLPFAVLLVSGCGSPTERAAEAAAQGQQLLDAGQFAAAAARLSYAVGQRDDLPGVWLLLGRAKAGLRDAPGAFIAYRNALDQDPGSREALLALSQISLSAGKYVEAEEYADRLLLLSPGSPDALVIKGFAAIGGGRSAQALQSADEALKIDPANELALTVKSMVAYRSGDLGVAARLLEPLLARGTSSIDALRQLRRIYWRTADVRGFAKVAARLVELNPVDARSQADLARALYLKGSLDAATRVLVRLGGDGGGTHRLIALSVWSGAELAPEPLMALPGRDWPVWLQLAFAEYALASGKPDLAMKILAGIGSSPASPDNLDRSGLSARALMALGRNSDSAAIAREALSVDPGQPGALEARGRLALARGDLDSALRDARKLVSDNPASDTGYRMLADIYQEQGSPVLADKAVIDASNAAPSSVVQLQYAASYFRRRSKMEQALTLAREFTASNTLSRTGWRVREFICKDKNDLPCAARAAEFLRRLNGYPIDSRIEPENSNLIED